MTNKGFDFSSFVKDIFFRITVTILFWMLFCISLCVLAPVTLLYTSYLLLFTSVNIGNK